MARTDNLYNFLEDVSDAIKNKKGDETPIKASDFDTEITNLPTGSDVVINSISDIITAVNESMQQIVDAIRSKVDNYPKLIDTPVTLYTPNINYKYYVIQKRSSGRYRILWASNSYVVIKTNNDEYQTCVFNIQNFNAIKPVFQENTISNLRYYNDSITPSFYISGEMNTIADCVNAMQNRNTSYNAWYSGFIANYINDTDYKIPVANVAIFNADYIDGVGELLLSQKVSAEENIEQQ